MKKGQNKQMDQKMHSVGEKPKEKGLGPSRWGEIEMADGPICKLCINEIILKCKIINIIANL